MLFPSQKHSRSRNCSSRRWWWPWHVCVAEMEGEANPGDRIEAHSDKSMDS